MVTPVDLLIIGGGINGAGIACDAAGRGLSVHLCEQNDLGSGTSSKSTKLIHGGLRYLEYFQFRLVRESLIEREILLRKAPHLIAPLDFVLPHHPGLRSALLIRAGLFLYDHLGQRSLLPASQSLDLTHTIYGEPLKADYKKGFMYPDCWVDDARLVVANAMAAREHGALISTYSKVTSLKRGEKFWQAEVLDQLQQRRFTVEARAVINATGPWALQFLQATHLQSQYRIRLVKGSHIIVPQLYKGEQAYILQQTDERVVFAIPYQHQSTLIGTTEVDYQGDPALAEISPDEIDYLCRIINDYFKKPIEKNQIIASFAGVRPLFDKELTHEAKALSRDYAFELNVQAEQPLLTILGGKITTYRILAEHALAQLKPFFPHMKNAWTATAPLPGGDMAQADFAQFLIKLQKDFPALPQPLLYRLAHQYGTRSYLVLANVKQEADLGRCFGTTLYAREIEYLREYEWLRTVDDLLNRRTKLGLQFESSQVDTLKEYLGLHLNLVLYKV